MNVISLEYQITSMDTTIKFQQAKMNKGTEKTLM